MTLLVVILSITNIAIGYGLAIYMGHAPGRAAKTVRAARSKQAKKQPAAEESWQEPVTAAPPAAVAPQPVIETHAPELVVAPPVAAVIEPVATAPAPPAPAPVSTPVAAVATPQEVASEPVAEQVVLEQIEEVRAEIHDTPAPATIVEALAAETKPETESAAPATDEAAASAEPVSKEALLESINAFQAQLKKQQELAKLHAVTSKTA